MAKIIPIDVIKGISGKYGSKTSDYFATNSSSGKIHLAKVTNPYQGPASEKQLAQQSKFGARQAVATAWLNANKELRDADGNVTREASAEYKQALKLKRSLKMSQISQVLYKYMDDTNTIQLPNGEAYVAPSGGSTGTKYTVTAIASPTNGGTVTGGGQYEAGATAALRASAASGYTFTRWSDGVTTASRTVTVSGNVNLSAIFTANAGGENPGGDEDPENSIR